MNYYFAYGSNMDQKQMFDRCPKAKLLGPAQLHGYRLAFTIFSPKRECGCADVVESEKDTVYGLLYELTDVDLERMDRFEGCPDNYRRISVVIDKDGKNESVVTYEVVNKKNDLIPSEDYMKLICDAAKEFNFPEAYQTFLLSVPTKKVEISPK